MLIEIKGVSLHLSLVADVAQAEPLFFVAVWLFFATAWRASTAQNTVQDGFQSWCLKKRPQPDLSHLNSCCHGMHTDRILECIHLCEVIHVIISQLQAQHASQEKPQKAADTEESGSPFPPHQSINLLAVGWIRFCRWKRRGLTSACLFTSVWEFERFPEVEPRKQQNRVYTVLVQSNYSLHLKLQS